MTWVFCVSAKDERKLYSRLFLVLEQQWVSIQSVHAEAREGQVKVTFVLYSEEDKTDRIKALFYRLQDVTDVLVREQ